jgi:hypothetical protein
MNCPFEGFYLPIFLTTALHFVTRSGMHGAPLISHIYTFMGMNLKTNSSVAMQNSTDVVVEDGRRGL